MTTLQRRMRAVAPAALLIVTVLGGCAEDEGEAAGGRTAAAVPVVTMTVADRTFVEYGEYFGEARGVEEVRLSAIAGGTVEAIHASEGDRVEAGQSLARVDADRIEAQYRTAVLNEQLARDTYERERRFLEQGNSFQLKVDQAQLAWLQSQSALLEATKVRDAAVCISPIDGTVVTRFVEMHEELAPGAATFDVADLSRLKIAVGVPEADIAGVRELESAEVRFSSYPDREWTGRPTRLARRRSDRTLTYHVEVVIDNEDGTLLSGQTARVRLALRTWDNVIVVPSSTVYTRADRTYVMVARDGFAREVAVRVGPNDERHTVILDGLSVGDRLITEGINRLRDGMTIGAGRRHPPTNRTRRQRYDTAIH